MSVINHFYGRDHIPIGAYRGPLGRPTETPGPAWTNRGAGWYVDKLADAFPSPVKDASQVGDATAVFRRALAAAPLGRSVTVVSVGHATNLLALLRSAPDEASPLTGLELVKQKVRKLVWMGGSYWVSDRVEWNWGACGGAANPNASTECGSYAALPQLTSAALKAWPAAVPTVFVSFDIGFWVRSGGVLRDGHPERSPCRQAYLHFCGGTGGGGGLPTWCDARGRNAWDLMAVVLAVRGAGRFYKLLPGFNAVDTSTGLNLWRDEPWRPPYVTDHVPRWQQAPSGHYEACEAPP